MVAVAAGGAFALAQHGSEYSKLDGDYVAEFSGPQVSTVADGTFMASFDAYMDERLPGRDSLLATHAAFTAHALRDPVTDNVFLGGPGGQLLERPADLTVPDSLADDAAKLADSLGDIPLLWAYAPRKEEVYADALPQAWSNPYPHVHDEIIGALAASGDVLDFSDMMTERRADGTAFFRTDHHWTPAAARAAADAAAQRLREDGVLLGTGPSTYLDETSGRSFIGSTGRRATRGLVAGDEFTYPAPAGGFAATMCIDDECGLPTFDSRVAVDRGLYQNRYAAFIGGDNGMVTITNPSPQARGRVLLVKDSFGNAFATYLAERVSELVVVDERHYEGLPLNVLASTMGADAVIVLHNPLSLLSESFDPSVWTTRGDIARQEYPAAPAAEVALARAVPGVFGSTVIVDDTGLSLTLGPDQPLGAGLATDARKLADAIDATGVPQVWVYAPRKEEAFADRVPSGMANPVDAKRDTFIGYLNEAHPIIDLTPMLSDPLRRDDFYFRTDHHWTSDGAQVAVDEIIVALADEGVHLGPDDRTWEVVTGPQRFLGSNAAELPKSEVLPAEQFWYRAPQGGFNARLCSADVCDESVIYAPALTDPDTHTNRYKAFLNGGFAPQHLHNSSPTAQGTIVMLKDSYGHPVAMKLAEQARDIYLVDERGWDGQPLAEFVEDVDADAVVMIHNQVSTLSQAFDRDVWRNAGD